MTNQQSLRAADFLNTLGVQTHVPYTDGGYANIGNIAADLSYLGITQVRDGISDGRWGSASLASYIKLARQGVTFTIGVIDSTVADTASLNARLDLVRRLVAAVPGSVTAIEGANEINNWPVTFNGVGGLQGAIDMQRALYSAVHADPALAGIAVDYFTGYGVGNGTGPDPSTTPGLADYDTQHPYPRNGDAPAGYMDPAKAASNETPGHTGPLVYTETGYSSNGGTWGAVDQSVQARYTLDLLFDAAQAGVARTDLYELMDAYATGSPQGNAGFGLFDTASRPKLVATAIHNLTTILADKGTAAATFQTGGFSPVLTGLPATGRNLILQKSNGVNDLVVWAEPKIWDPATGTEIAPPTQSVTAALGATYATVSVFDPLVGTGPMQTFSNVSVVTLALTDHPLIVEVSGLLAAAPTVTVDAERLVQDTGLSGTDNVTCNGTVTLSGTMTGAAGTSVQVLDGTIVLGQASLGAGGVWGFTTSLAKGTHKLSATATDPSGLVATAQAAAPITVVTDPPTIALGSVTVTPDGTTTTLTGTVSGAGGTGVTVYNGKALLGAATVDANGGWRFAAGLAPGRYTLTAVATDLAGNTASIAPPVVVPSAAVAAPDTLVVRLSEDAYQGDAQFSVTVDGTAVGGVQSVSASHRSGQTQDFTFTGAFGTGTHTVGISFLNDLYKPGVGDRNLYVSAITLDGTTTTLNRSQMSQGTVGYQVTAAVAAPDTLTLNLSEDAYLGDAQFTVSVDGRQVGGTQSVTASHGANQSAMLSLVGNFGTGVHTVGVNFLNDLYKPGVGDRNLYVRSIALDGTTTMVNAAQMSGGTKNYKVQTPAAAALASASPLSVSAGATLILDKGAAAGAAVTFNGAGGTLQLIDAGGFHGTIGGLAKSDTLDLRSIAFSGGAVPTLSYAGDGSGGTLTVSDGRHLASLSLQGANGASSFTMAADGAGGVAIGVLR